MQFRPFFAGLLVLTGLCLTSQSFAQTEDAIRQYGAIGIRTQGQDFIRESGWVDKAWDKQVGPAYNASTCAFEEHFPTIMMSFRWSGAYVDQSIKPTRAQARDPNWSNYIWNRSNAPAGKVNDSISEALNSKLIANGNGPAKLAIVMSFSATGTRLSPPAWMYKDSSLTWLEGVNSNNSNENWHLRLDNPAAVAHTADFMHAFLQKYGDNRGIHSITFNEYFLGQQKYRPSNLDRNKYLAGALTLWKETIASAPRDATGKRVNIAQTNPILSNSITLKVLDDIGMGVSMSDTAVHFPLEPGSLHAQMREVSNSGRIHLMLNGDARFAASACRSVSFNTEQRWDGSPNPFGHRAGYTALVTPQELFWYHGSRGQVPLHSMFMTLDEQCGPQNLVNFIDALDTFGRCGTEASKWGHSPIIHPDAEFQSNVSRPSAIELVVQ